MGENEHLEWRKLVIILASPLITARRKPKENTAKDRNLRELSRSPAGVWSHGVLKFGRNLVG